MFQSKNCGHGFDLYVKCQVLARSALAPLTPEGELRDRLEDMTGETYVNFTPAYCPICGSWITYTPSYGYDAYWNQSSLSRCPKCDAKL